MKRHKCHEMSFNVMKILEISWKVMKRHEMSETSWNVSNVMKCHETSWNIMTYHKMETNVIKCPKHSWNSMKCNKMSSRNVMKHQKMSWNIKRCHETSWDVTKCHETLRFVSVYVNFNMSLLWNYTFSQNGLMKMNNKVIAMTTNLWFLVKKNLTYSKF